MPIAVLGLSGYCNGYRATVAMICNNLSHLSRSLYQLRLGRFYHNQSHLDRFHCLYLSHNPYYSSQPLSQSYLDRPLHQHHLSRFYYDRSHLSRFYHGRSRLDQFRCFHLSYGLYYLSRSLRQPHLSRFHHTRSRLDRSHHLYPFYDLYHLSRVRRSQVRRSQVRCSQLRRGQLHHSWLRLDLSRLQLPTFC